MQLPNKLYSYRDSTLALLPALMKEMRSGAMPAAELYNRVRPLLKDPTDFVSAMDCLYALQVTDINDEGEVFLC